LVRGGGVVDENRAERVCPPSELKSLNNPLRRLVHSPRRLLGPHVGPGDTALDLGCGGGFFTVELARLVGPEGHVIAVDLQPEMLDFTRGTVEKRGLLDRVTLHLCREDDLSLDGVEADFALAFYVVHEVPDRRAFLAQLARLLKPGGRFLMVEPRHHASRAVLGEIIAEAEEVGLRLERFLGVFLSPGALFVKG
jgi:ubiquinone/menaquinone biosynthesis C-methylase UbiE